MTAHFVQETKPKRILHGKTNAEKSKRARQVARVRRAAAEREAAIGGNRRIKTFVEGPDGEPVTTGELEHKDVVSAVTRRAAVEHAERVRKCKGCTLYLVRKRFGVWPHRCWRCKRDRLREQWRKYRAANPEKRRERQRKSQAASHEKRLERQRKRRAANPEKEREASRKRRAANPEKERERQRKYQAAHRAAHPEKYRERARERARKWRAAHPEKLREARRKWSEKKRKGMATK